MKRRGLLNWKYLLENKCPSCGADLATAYNMITRRFTCRCTFSISEEKYKKIVSDITLRKLDKEQEEKLNDDILVLDNSIDKE